MNNTEFRVRINNIKVKDTDYRFSKFFKGYSLDEYYVYQ